MPKRAWCNECKALVILTDEGLCPNGHQKPSLRGIEEVAYATQPTERAPHVSEAAVLADAAPSTSTSGGYDAGSAAPAVAMDNPSQSAANAYSYDPMLQVQLDADAMRVNRTLPWTETWPSIVLFLVFFWPAGLVFLWRSSLPSTGTKWGITGCIAAVITFSVIRAMFAYQMAMSAFSTAHP
jgi:hypothetical protein